MKTYTSPEILELGKAENLTLGCSCSCSDCCGKKQSGEGELA